MSKKLKSNVFTYGIIALIIGLSFAVGTYAYYQTTITGTVNGTVLAWNCDLGSSGVQKNTFANMYPGSTGTITFNVTSSITSSYKINIKSYSNMNTGARANLKLYKDASYSSAIAANSEAASGSITSNGGTSSSVIYYKWDYGTSAETYTTAVPSFTYEIICTQN